TQDIEVLSAPVAPTFTANDSTICSGETVTLSGSGSGTVDYNIYDAASGGNLLGTAPLNVSPSTTTTYYLEAVGTNGCGNIGGTQPLMINVNPNPALSVSPDLQICPGQTATLTASGNGNFSWSTGETTSSISVTPTETSFYIVTLTDANGCTSSYQSTISVMTGSYVEALNDNATTNIDELVNIDVATNDNGDPLSVVIITNAINGVGSVQSDGTINYLPFSGYLGSDSLQYVICDIYCSYTCDSAWVKIEIDKADEFSIPGGFSPNGDGINEFFVISGLDSYPNNTLTIYNRWGDIVFSASPYMNNWSGQAEGKRTISGDVVVTGTYFYVLDLGDGSEMLNGSIEIKK
ncbi:MAG: gliding motility-associated C-terminal domain-containing protein, partial [Crocinitomicaceae bacterium]